MSTKKIHSVAKNATLHCLTGCSIGEIAGLIIGTVVGLNNFNTIVLAIVLAFIFGISLSTLQLKKAGLAFGAALSVAFAADSLSIAAMEVADNAVMALIPGAMGAGLVNPLYWIAMSVALFSAFLAAYPVNLFLLKRGKGHALIHSHMQHHGHTHA